MLMYQHNLQLYNKSAKMLMHQQNQLGLEQNQESEC